MRQNEHKGHLKPCPFCGSEDVETHGAVLLGETEETFRCGCPDCGVWYDWLFRSKEEAEDAWNARADCGLKKMEGDGQA